MNLTEDNFVLFAAKHYDMKRSVGVEEFKDDLKRVQYLKRLFKRYDDGGDLKVRLILNHMIVIYNCFGPEATKILFLKLDGYHQYLKPFVVFLNFLPAVVEIGETVIQTSDIPLDQRIIDELRNV